MAEVEGTEIQEEREAISLDPKWPLHPDLPLEYANYFSIMNTGSEVVITFGEFLPNLSSLQADEEAVQAYLDEAEVRPVARIALSQAGFEALYNLLKRNVERGENDG